MKNRNAILIVLLLVALIGGGYFVSQQDGQVAGYSEVGLSVREPAVSFEDGVGATSTNSATPVIYEVRVRLENLDLYSPLPSLDGEENLGTRNYLFNGKEGILRGILVSMNPRLDFFKVGDVLMLETNARELALAVPGDVVTFYCKVNVLESTCGEEGSLDGQLCLELSNLKSCVLVKIRH